MVFSNIKIIETDKKDKEEYRQAWENKYKNTTREEK
jgi:hypothetical protein